MKMMLPGSGEGAEEEREPSNPAGLGDLGSPEQSPHAYRGDRFTLGSRVAGEGVSAEEWAGEERRAYE